MNSRTSVAGAGWNCPAQDLQGLMPPEIANKRFNWLRPTTLLGARNHVLASLLGDPSHSVREQWLDLLYPHGGRTLLIDRSTQGDKSFILMGDTGEGDTSQYAVLEVFYQRSEGTAFVFICSDVIYPAGQLREYAYKLLWPYRDYPSPIYAIPGNHDWYDSLRGFMAFFCGVTGTIALDAPESGNGDGTIRRWLRKKLWRDRDDTITAEQADIFLNCRRDLQQRSSLPGPYYVIRTGPIDLVALDTGIDGRIDAQQAAWLRQVSLSNRPKILLTGKPLVVDGKEEPGEILGSTDTVLDIVRAPEHRYIAAVGGDIHNYQRYPMTVGDRKIQFIVSGGGGAFMHPTHTIPNIDTTELRHSVTEEDFKCFPLRGDSLSMYSKIWSRKLPFSDLTIGPIQASLYMKELLGIAPTKDDAVGEVTDETRRRAAKIFPLPGRPRAPMHMVFSEFFDWNDPPLFKHLLRVDMTDSKIVMRCWGASGCTSDADRLHEDEVTYSLAEDAWR